MTFRRLLFPIVDIHIGDLDIPMYREIALRPDHAQSLTLPGMSALGRKRTCVRQLTAKSGHGYAARGELIALMIKS